MLATIDGSSETMYGESGLWDWGWGVIVGGVVVFGVEVSVVVVVICVEDEVVDDMMVTVVWEGLVAECL